MIVKLIIFKLVTPKIHDHICINKTNFGKILADVARFCLPPHLRIHGPKVPKSTTMVLDSFKTILHVNEPIPFSMKDVLQQ